MKRLRTGRFIQVLVAIIIGAVTGLIVFSVTRITGRNLFLITGGIAGAAAILVLQLYWRTARLSEVKIMVPQVSELTFVVNNDARQAAWKFYIETVTRVSTQPLTDDEGLISEALTSLYGLFATTRETLKDSRPSVPVSGDQTVEHLAVTMLNHELRPFLTKWHPRLSEFEKSNPDAPESAWPDSQRCRAELRTVQSNLTGFALGFARLAGVRGAEVGLVPAQRTPADANQPSRAPRATQRLPGSYAAVALRITLRTGQGRATTCRPWPAGCTPGCLATRTRAALPDSSPPRGRGRPRAARRRSVRAARR